MASTNITNIKNAFTLSSTLGNDPGQQKTKDPTYNKYNLLTISPLGNPFSWSPVTKIGRAHV